MRKITSLAGIVGLALGLGFAFWPLRNATSGITSGQATVNATVIDLFEVTIEMAQLQAKSRCDTSGIKDAVVIPFGAMNFGNIIYKKNAETNRMDAGTSDFYYTVWVSAASNHGRTYTLNHSGAALKSGNNTIDGAFVCTPMHMKVDNWNGTISWFDPTGDPTDRGTEATPNPDLKLQNSTSRVTRLYTSGATGASQTIQVVYGVSGDPKNCQNGNIPNWTAVSMDQPTGTYAATVTITLTE